MRALVVYESLWGNTERVAKAVAHGLEAAMTVELVDVDSAPQSLEDYDLVLVGGPTHAFSMSRVSTRHSAATDKGVQSVPQRGIREWLGSVRHVSRPIPAASFDTRVASPRLPGSAARAARHELRSLGLDTRAKPASFHVQGYEGPLLDGELDRAEQWAHGFLPSAAIRT